jgi:hypothetical protein
VRRSVAWRGGRIWSVLAGVSLLASLFFPYWAASFFSPLYPEGPPTIKLYASRFEGTLREIEVLTGFIGIKFSTICPEYQCPEFSIFPFLFPVLSLLCFWPAFRPERRLLKVSLGVVLLALLLMGGYLQWRLWILGHVLDPEAPFRDAAEGGVLIPLVGPSFLSDRAWVLHYLHVGGGLACLAPLFLFLALRATRRHALG